VGAGFAGLAAARRLRTRGKSVALVEARDRVGGRVWNRTAADGSVVSVVRRSNSASLCKNPPLILTFDSPAPSWATPPAGYRQPLVLAV